MQSSTNLLIQYILVGVILSLALVWIVWKFINIRKEKTTSKCSGCSFSDACAKKSMVRNSK